MLSGDKIRFYHKIGVPNQMLKNLVRNGILSSQDAEDRISLLRKHDLLDVPTTNYFLENFDSSSWKEIGEALSMTIGEAMRYYKENKSLFSRLLNSYIKRGVSNSLKFLVRFLFKALWQVVKVLYKVLKLSVKVVFHVLKFIITWAFRAIQFLLEGLISLLGNPAGAITVGVLSLLFLVMDMLRRVKGEEAGQGVILDGSSGATPLEPFRSSVKAGKPVGARTQQVSSDASFTLNKALSVALRANNPLNIRPSRDKWQGAIGTHDTKSGKFVVFESLEHGYRAAFKNIKTIMSRGNVTPRQLINVWAPASDNNNPENYARIVCDLSGGLLQMDTPIDIYNQAQMVSLMKGMTRVEMGRDSASLISDEVIINGYKLFLDQSVMELTSALVAQPDTAGTKTIYSLNISKPINKAPR